MMISLVVSSCRAMMKRENVFECSYADEWGWERYSLFEVDLGIHNEDGKSAGATSNKLMVDPHGFEGYLKMEVEVPDSS
ncbi:hypothetical protein Tco_1304662 [Tanacetum coccineum]